MGRTEDQGTTGAGFTRTCKCRRSQPCTRCSTATGWSSTASDGETGHREHHSPNRVERTTCGAPITRVSSCSPTSATAIRCRSPISPAATSWPVRRFTPPRRFTLSPCSSAEFGLPRAIRTDNGVPFASPNALFNLSRLSVWWLRLGIDIERIKPGNPQQNGRHERMHPALKLETTKPAGANFLQQQARFDDFVEEFNIERPHQALIWPAQPSATAFHRAPTADCRVWASLSTTRR